jgi:hypothetical protein
LDILGDAGGLETWKYYGGFQTLISYGIAPPMKPDPDEQKQLVSALVDRIPDSHRRFFDNLRPSFSCGDFFPTPVSGQVFHSGANAKKICCGFVTNPLKVRGISGNSSCTVILLCLTLIFARIVSI